MRGMNLTNRMISVFEEEARPLTVDEFARAVRARTTDVRAVLKSDPRFVQTLPSRHSPKAKVYVVRDYPDPQDGLGRQEGEAA